MQHARRSEIFGIPRATGDFSAQIGGYVVLTNELLFSHVDLRISTNSPRLDGA